MGKMSKKFNWQPIILMAVVFGVLLLPGYAKYQELKHADRQLETNIKQAKLDRLNLEEERVRLEKDDFYSEKLAREKMGIVKKGEIVYKIVPEEK
jgi:cell division protein FtsB